MEVTLILIIKEVEYAIMILDELYNNGPMSAKDISDARDIPSPFIYRVLKKLQEKGILSVKRGPRGGYELCGDCDQLTLYDVIGAFENTFLVIECMKSDYDCSRNDDMGCCLHKEFGRIQGTLKREFRSRSLASLFAREDEEKSEKKKRA